MKKISKTILSTCLIGGMILQTGCFGTFKLTHKLYDFNSTVGDKIVKEAVFLALTIIPIYEGCAFIDAVVLNTIEFWTGKNPLAMKEGEKDSKTITSNGKTYEINAVKNKFIVKEISGPEAGKLIEVEFNSTDKNWTLIDGSVHHKLTQELNDGSVNVYLPNGKIRNFSSGDNVMAVLKSEKNYQ